MANLVSTYPTTIAISATAAHGFSLPELPDQQVGGSVLAQTFTQGQTFTAIGYVKVTGAGVMGGNPYWWVDSNASLYVSASVTLQQPDTSVAALTAPPSSWNALIAEADGEAAAAANPIAVVTNGVSGIWNGFTGVIQSAATAVTGGAVGSTIVDVIALVIVAFLIYAILKTGALNTVHFDKKKTE